MNFNRPALVRAIRRAASIADARGTLPILSQALIRPSDGRISVHATNLDMALSVAVTATECAPGPAFCVGAKQLATVLDKLDGDTVSLTHEGAQIVVKAGRRRFTLPTSDGDDFPPLPEAGDAAPVAVDSGDLATAIRAVLPCVATDDTRLHLSSLCLHVAGGKVEASATDGRRLAAYRMTATPADPMLVPLRAAKELLKHVEDTDTAQTAIYRVGAWLFIDGELAIKTADAKFPPVEQVLGTATEHEWSLSVASAALLAAFESAALVSPDLSNVGSLTVGDDGTLLVRAESASGAFAEKVDVDYEKSHSGATIGVHCGYMVDAVKSCDAESVTVRGGGELDPMAVTAGDVTVIVMPMRL